MSIKVTNPTMINGRSADSFTVSDLIDLITVAEKAISVLDAMSTDSKTVKALQAREAAGIKALVTVLDARKID